MRIALKQVIPAPLAGISFAQTCIWGSDVELSSSNKTLILAGSGMGKSTLLAFLYGLRMDFTGEILLEGKSTKEIKLTEWSKIRQEQLSMVLQELKLFPHLTARENIQIKAQLTKHKSTSEIEAMASLLGVEQKLDQPCHQLSLGQQQRIAIIRALCQPFKLLLMDEPFSHIDQANIEKACTLIENECTANQAGLVLTSLGEKYPIAFNQTLNL